MSGDARDALLEAYQRLHRFGPEFGGDEQGNNGLTNHGPMAVEVILRRGLDLDITRWLDRYERRLAPLPTSAHPITERGWRAALADPRRLPDWTAWFRTQLRDRPWRDVLASWWPTLLPGIAAGSTHGVIRVAHAVRALLTFGADPAAQQALDELAHGLAFWAARYRRLPRNAAATGVTPTSGAFAAVPRLEDQSGYIAERIARLAHTPGWAKALRAVRGAAADDVPARLAELIDIATRAYLRTGHAAPVLLVHTATAPSAVLHTLPALPRELWPASFDAAWTASAAITAMYSPPLMDATPARTSPTTGDPAAAALDRAAAHGDEHVLKFTDTAVEAYQRRPDPELLAAATHATTLIARPG